MDPTQKGIVNTCFLTTRIPSWAGARQNVTGSNLEGRPVPSNIGGPVSASVEQLDSAVAAVNAIIAELKTQVTDMQTRVANLQQEVQGLRAAPPAAP
ncbi:IX [Bat mastadenovirus]|uniref:IX n=1 Tax=Bat mastadenovirus TaxID=740971 RepID=A0A3G9EJP1_9ADEN|nr:IX [Bat mastadenovirus]BBE29302.1 IX [Bat mastadenovirus]